MVPAGLIVASSMLMACSQQAPSKERIPLPRPRPPMADRLFIPSVMVDDIPIYSDVPPAPPIPKRQRRME